MSRLKIALLGPLLVTRDNEQLTGFEYDKVRALLAYLSLEADRPHRREALAGLLWPDQAEKSARDSLRNALATLRKTIGDDTTNPPYLFITREAIQFDAASDHTVDVAEFDHLLGQARQHRHRHPAACRLCARWRRSAADLYRGPLLAQFSLPDSPEYEHWLLGRRETLHRTAQANFEWLANFYLRRGDSDAARFFAGRQLAYEPWNEPAHRQMMLALARAGDRVAALRQYQSCVRALAEELGVEPEPATTVLLEQIRDGALPHERLVPVVAAPFAPLIGRERDLATLGNQLADPDVRLVTIIGPGGVGKTSLALAAAHQFGSDFSDGSIYVSLMSATEAGELFPTLATTLGIITQPSLSIEDQVINYLQSRDMLLLLDNFEQLLAAAPSLTRLIAAAPGVVLLVTSRQRLNLAAEWLYDLQGLDFPAEGTADPLSGFSAMQLFARRARQERRDFALVSAEATAAADICRLVEGMPLAIELAAAATGTQPVSEIARQLRAGLDALAAEWADVPPRHRSIRAAFEHSWATLTEDERHILRGLSVFSGGFEPEAAESVIGATPDDLRRLRDKSLLQSGDSDRINMHPLIRSFAAERLVARGETQVIAEKHLVYFTALAEAGEQSLKGRDQLAWIKRLRADHANVLAALTWAEAHDVSAAGRLAAAMWLFWFMDGHGLESRRRYERLLPYREKLPPILRACLLKGYAWTLLGQTDLLPIEEIAREELAICLAEGNDEGIAFALHQIALSFVIRGNLDNAFEQATRGVEHARAYLIQLADNIDPSPATWCVTVLTDSLSFILTAQGRTEQAETASREALRLSDLRGNRWMAAYSYLRLGHIYFQRVDLENAVAAFTQSLAIAEDFGDHRLLSFAASGLAEALAHLGKQDKVSDLAGQAARQSQEVGMVMPMSEALQLLGKLMGHHQIAPEAAAVYQQLVAKHTTAHVAASS